MSPNLLDLLSCCRCCLKVLASGHKTVKISKPIKIRFLQLTAIELLDSEFYSNVICESCNSKLSEFSDFRSELTENQTKLYEMCVEESVFQEDEAAAAEELTQPEEQEQYFVVKNEDETLEELVDDEYIVEEVEQYSESDLIVTTSGGLYPDVVDDSNEPKYDYQLGIAGPRHQKRKCEKTKLCEICNQTFAASGIYHHMMRSHVDVCRFKCDFCGKGFNLKNDLINHIKRHLNRENRTRYPCTYCPAKFLSHTATVNHVKFYHSNVVEIVTCEYCHKEFKSRMKYLQHRKVVHESSGDFPCSICGKIFPARGYMEKHVENVHGELKPCIYCGKMYKPASLKRHMQSHGERKITCPYENCGKVYQMKVSLKHHISAHHERQECVNCEHCGTSFPTHRHLTRHINRQHASEKLQCEVEGCSNLFSRKDYLAEHYKRHKDIDEDTRNELLARVKSTKIISW